MSEPVHPPSAVPIQPPGGARPVRARGCLFPFVLVALFVSLLANLGLVLALVTGAAAEAFDNDDGGEVRERFYLGEKGAGEKVAVVRLDGVISESGIAHAVKQAEHAAKDPKVKAVVLRVDSPGGTVTASEELYQTLVSLRDDNGRRFKGTGPKPILVSMGSVAASGGYYVSMAGSPIYAEKTTITGSIGVFAALPNVAALADRNGVKLELVKAGDIKASGSFFHALSPEERQTWQDTVDTAYDTFLGVIEQGRPALTKERMRKEVVIDSQVPVRDTKGNPDPKAVPKEVRYRRTRADGGTFTADQAKQFGLIDEVGDLPAAVRAAAAKAGLRDYRAVTYSKPPSLLDAITGGAKVSQQGLTLDAGSLNAALTPRVWYLSPSADGSILSAGR